MQCVYACACTKGHVTYGQHVLRRETGTSAAPQSSTITCGLRAAALRRPPFAAPGRGRPGRLRHPRPARPGAARQGRPRGPVIAAAAALAWGRVASGTSRSKQLPWDDCTPWAAAVPATKAWGRLQGRRHGKSSPHRTANLQRLTKAVPRPPRAPAPPALANQPHCLALADPRLQLKLDLCPSVL
jgi:hypothetical protein